MEAFQIAATAGKGANTLRLSAIPLLVYYTPVGALLKLTQPHAAGQCACLLAWLAAGSHTQAAWFSLASVEPARWLAAAVLLGAGQALNIGVYRALGKLPLTAKCRKALSSQLIAAEQGRRCGAGRDGVYYGTKLGKAVPWCRGFPFSVAPHPQYLGSTLTARRPWPVLCARPWSGSNTFTSAGARLPASGAVP